MWEVEDVVEKVWGKFEDECESFVVIDKVETAFAIWTWLKLEWRERSEVKDKWNKRWRWRIDEKNGIDVPVDVEKKYRSDWIYFWRYGSRWLSWGDIQIFTWVIKLWF